MPNNAAGFRTDLRVPTGPRAPSGATPRTIEANGFSEESIVALAAGSIAAIRVPSALSPDEYSAAVAVIDQVGFSTYDPARVFPPVTKFGVSINDHRSNGLIDEGYWQAVEEAQRAWSSLQCELDIFKRCRELIGRSWPHGIELGRRGDRMFGPGIIREINLGLQVHFDDAAVEHASELFEAKLISQFAFNLYLLVPASGGELVIWPHTLQPGDEEYLIPGGYGFKEEVVEPVQPIVIPPRAGEAILFDPRNFHTVRPAGVGRRVSLGFSVALLDTGRLVVWA